MTTGNDMTWAKTFKGVRDRIRRQQRAGTWLGFVLWLLEGSLLAFGLTCFIIGFAVLLATMGYTSGIAGHFAGWLVDWLQH